MYSLGKCYSYTIIIDTRHETLYGITTTSNRSKMCYGLVYRWSLRFQIYSETIAENDNTSLSCTFGTTTYSLFLDSLNCRQIIRAQTRETRNATLYWCIRLRCVYYYYKSLITSYCYHVTATDLVSCAYYTYNTCLQIIIDRRAHMYTNLLSLLFPGLPAR